MSNSFKLCPIVLNYVQHIISRGSKNFRGGFSPPAAPSLWHNEGGICPRAQHIGGAKLRSECYVVITKRHMSADALNYNLQIVECHCEISSRSPRFAKRAIMNLSDVSRRRFCLQQ